MAIELTQEIGRRITSVTEETRETTFLFQLLSMALQRGNAVSFQHTLTSEWDVVATIWTLLSFILTPKKIIIIIITEDTRETVFLYQRPSIALQRRMRSPFWLLWRCVILRHSRCFCLAQFSCLWLRAGGPKNNNNINRKHSHHQHHCVGKLCAYLESALCWSTKWQVITGWFCVYICSSMLSCQSWRTWCPKWNQNIDQSSNNSTVCSKKTSL